MSESKTVSPTTANWLKLPSEAGFSFISIALVLTLGIVDFLTPPEIKLTLFYLMIIGFAAWFGGKRTGLIVVTISSLLFLVGDIRSGLGHESNWASAWNVAMIVGIYVLTDWVVSALRTSTSELKRRVSDRSAALEREVVERSRTEEQLGKTVQQLRHLAENMNDVFWLRNVGDLRIGYVNPAYETIWGRSVRDLYLKPEGWLEAVHPEDRERVKRAFVDFDSQANGHGEYRVVRADGSMRWVKEHMFAIRDHSGKVARVVGIVEDNTAQRKLEREIIEVSDREHSRIGQDLHDGLCQKMIALAFDIGSLEQKLAARNVQEVEAVRLMSTLVDDLITEARATARGLFPVRLETDGLGSALQELAANVSSRMTLECRAQCEPPVFVRDNSSAIHLYRIAQEAINNAVKHSKAKSVVVTLNTTSERIELRIVDDGVGIVMPSRKGEGMGLHIMDYRARMIGGTLSIMRGETGGTVVSCVAPQTVI